MISRNVSARAAASRPTSAAGSLVLVVMGVAGSGKTTIGSALARELGWSFRDADEFHSAANIAKMSAGVPLTDVDRAPWLAAIAEHIRSQLRAGAGAVVTCSALKARYRAALAVDPTRVQFVLLSGEYDVILARLQQRQGHFMRPEMLRSQFEALEIPADGLRFDVAQPPAEIIRGIRAALGLTEAANQQRTRRLEAGQSG